MRHRLPILPQHLALTTLAVLCTIGGNAMAADQATPAESTIVGLGIGYVQIGRASCRERV